MSLFETLVSFRGARKARLVADELADRLTSRVWEEAGPNSLHLALAEARGYFRAHANRVVRAELKRLENGPQALGPWQAQETSTLAAETIVIRLLQNLLRYRNQKGQRAPSRKAA